MTGSRLDHRPSPARMAAIASPTVGHKIVTVTFFSHRYFEAAMKKQGPSASAAITIITSAIVAAIDFKTMLAAD